MITRQSSGVWPSARKNLELRKVQDGDSHLEIGLEFKSVGVDMITILYLFPKAIKTGMYQKMHGLGAQRFILS